ncbi:hypothetical protein P4K24_03340, partial [Bacillus cereus]|nr:hypothetical protein [Bacillus cereus]
MSQMILRPLSRNILRRPRVILQVSHESKKIKFKHTIRGGDMLKRILLVSTSAHDMNGHPTGLWLEEL